MTLEEKKMLKFIAKCVFDLAINDLELDKIKQLENVIDNIEVDLDPEEFCY